MKRTFFIAILFFAYLTCSAQEPIYYAPGAVQETYVKDATTGLYYTVSGEQATISTSKDKRKSGAQIPYSTSPMVIPQYFLMTVTTLEGERVDTIPVVELGEYALMNATFTSLSFAEPSFLTVFRKNAMKNVNNISGVLTLPSSLQELDNEAIMGSSMNITKLVVPASMDTLGLSAVLLPQLDTIEFLGTVPPTCAIANSTTAYNPWTGSISTPDSIVVIVPAGSLSLYQDAPGIGDYFTCLKKQPGPGTALEENEEAVVPQQKKVLRNGRLYILRDGVVYDAQGQRQ